MKKLTCFITGSVVLSFLLLFPISAGALPSLGVIPTETYNAIVSTWQPGDPFEGPFAFTGGDAASITVWYGNENNAFDPDVDVWIGTTEAGHDVDGNYDPDWIETPPPSSAIPSFWHTFG
ncbi:MAG: hypothetical protein GTO24_01405, partial [candidate division Zixibacteria bacterium]|nr:hypothetical protein [candidate division Zixibacteria bacterium]